MVTSCSDSDFERSNVSLKENKPDGVDLNSNDLDYCVRKNEEKFYGFRQTVLVKLIISPIHPFFHNIGLFCPVCFV